MMAWSAGCSSRTPRAIPFLKELVRRISRQGARLVKLPDKVDAKGLQVAKREHFVSSDIGRPCETPIQFRVEVWIAKQKRRLQRCVCSLTKIAQDVC